MRIYSDLALAGFSFRGLKSKIEAENSVFLFYSFLMFLATPSKDEICQLSTVNV